MMSKTIVIAGDSWGCGEWKNSRISHPGLTQYLIDSNYQVINLSQSNGPNRYSGDRISDFLQVNTYLQISCVIVFQTEWTRDIPIECPEVLANDLKYGYLELKNRLISRFYYNLSRASIKNNIPIYIVGGCSDTIWLDKFETEYPGLHIACQSLTNLLVENNHRNSDPVYGIFVGNTKANIEYFKKNISSKDLELLLQDIEKGHHRLTTWENNKEYFWPDGGHANQHGHRVLFEFLKTQIPDL
jgi:hypothetical protein